MLQPQHLLQGTAKHFVGEYNIGTKHLRPKLPIAHEAPNPLLH